MTINEVPNNKPNAPDNLTEVGDSKPIAPANLTEQGTSKPVAPANLTEQSGSVPLAPVNLTETAKSDPLAPANLTEIAGSDPLAPSVVSGTFENFVKFSEQFDNAAYNKTAGITVTPNQAIAPDGTLTADLIVIDTINRIIGQATDLPIGVLCTASVYIKGTLGNTIKMSAGGVEITIVLDGTFQRISNTAISNSTTFNLNTFGGATARSFLLWGAQLNKGGLAPYLQTTTAARTGNDPIAPANLTEVADSTPLAPVNLVETASAGINRTLSPLFNFNASLGLPDSVTYSRSSSASYIETFKGPLGRYQTRLTNDYVGSVENLALYSENFDNAVWGKLDLTFIKKQNEFICLEGNSSSEHRLDQNGVGVSYSSYTLTAKAYKGNRGIALRLGNNYTVTFDLINGIVESNNSNVIASIKYAGDGFYDCSVYNSAPSNDIIRMNLSSNGSLSYQGDNVSGVILKRAQVTVGAKPLPYVRTFESAVTEAFTAKPRYEEKGLLVEGASTNLAIRSEEISNASWSKINSTISVNEIQAPDGSFSADLLVEDGVNGPHSANLPISFAVNTVYTFSIYLKAGKRTRAVVTVGGTGLSGAGGSGADLVSIVDLTNGAIVSSLNDLRVEDAGNGWYRCSVTVTTDSDGGSIEARINLVQGTGTTTSYAGGGAGANAGVYMWGAQFEALPFASSYIRTEGSTVSRAAETLDSGLSINSSEMSVSVNYSTIGSSTFESLSMFELGSNLTDRLAIFSNVNNSDRRVILASNGSVVINAQAAGLTSDVVGRTTLTVKSNEGKFYVNDNLIFTDTSCIVPLLSGLIIGRNVVNSGRIYGHLKNAEVYDLALTAKEVKAL